MNEMPLSSFNHSPTGVTSPCYLRKVAGQFMTTVIERGPADR